MKNKFFKLSSIFLTLICIVLLIGCNTHEHTYTYYTVTEATCSTDGEKEGICSICGQKIYVPIPAEHQYAWEIISEPTCTKTGNTKGICVFCGHTTTTEIPTQEHTYIGDVCSICGQYKEYTYLPEDSDVGWTLEDIRDELNSYGFNYTSYTLLGLIDSSIFDLSLNHNGDLYLNATFNNNNANSYSLNLGKRNSNMNINSSNNSTISFIEFKIYECNVIYTDGTRESFGYLRSPSNENQIHAFALNTNGELLITYKDLHVVSVGRIKTDNTLQSNDLIYIKNGNSYSVYDVFNKNVQSIVIPPTHRGLPVTTISPLAFRNCTNLTEITLPNSIDTIHISAFNNCPKFKKIYSAKPKEQIQFKGQLPQQPNSNLLFDALWIIE